MQIHISPHDGVPIYRQIVNQVKYLVAAGRLKRGDEMPPIRRLAEDLLINPNTVARAYRDLEGSVNLRADLAQYLYAELPRIPVSARDHQSRGVVVPQVQSQFPGRGGSPRGARDHGHLRDDPAVVPDVRDRLRSTAAVPAGSAGRHLASG